MNWEALQGIAELVGALGVIISLIYLAAQVRQNTKSIRTASNQDLLTSFNGMLEFAKSSEYGAKIFDAYARQGLENLSQQEIAGVRVASVQILRVFEQAYLQRRAGLLDEDVWQGWEYNMKIVMGLPGVVVGWRSLRPILHPGFAELMESFAETSKGAAVDYLSGWGMDMTEFPKLDRSVKNRGADGHD